jgi:hypothetical protein
MASTLEAKKLYIQKLHGILTTPLFAIFRLQYTQIAECCETENEIIHNFKAAISQVPNWNAIIVRDFTEKLISKFPALSECGTLATQVLTLNKGILEASKPVGKKIVIKNYSESELIHAFLSAASKVVIHHPALFVVDHTHPEFEANKNTMSSVISQADIAGRALEGFLQLEDETESDKESDSESGDNSDKSESESDNNSESGKDSDDDKDSNAKESGSDDSDEDKSEKSEDDAAEDSAPKVVSLDTTKDKSDKSKNPVLNPPGGAPSALDMFTAMREKHLGSQTAADFMKLNAGSAPLSSLIPLGSLVNGSGKPAGATGSTDDKAGADSDASLDSNDLDGMDDSESES